MNTNLIKVVIIEDEVASQKLLTSIIEEYCDGIEIVGIANSVASGIDLITEKQTDIIFVDVQLEKETIFELLDQIEYKKYKIVFTTAYSNYAFQAFKYEAVDYLLKPYSPKEVIKVLERIKIDLLSQPWRQFAQTKAPKRLTVNSHDGIRFIEPQDILYCSADGSYCKVVVKNDSNLLVSKTLFDIESQLNPEQFIRVHASYLINMDHVKRFVKEDGGYILMSNGMQIPVSRRKRQEFLERVK